MQYRQLSSLLIITLVFSGCTAKTKGFFEDIYSQTETRSANKQDYATIKNVKNAPIIKDTPIESRTKLNGNYISDASQIYQATGTIIDTTYDKDVNLYVYAFIKNGESNPITFYYDKDLRPIKSKVSITVKDNFLTKISRHSTKIKTGKRKSSTIKVPTVEKIDTL
ncbi:MAG: hypothetical protein K0U47_10300 [Epsilonproteobacteria bacterium]|nr:hypothetical protein [Campylobacterota bacterium]